MEIIKNGYSKNSLVTFQSENENPGSLYTVLYFKDAHGVMLCDSCDIKDDVVDDGAFEWFCVSGDLEKLITKYNFATGVVYYPLNFEFVDVIFKKIEVESHAQNAFF